MIPSVLPAAPPGRGLSREPAPPPRGVAGAGRARLRRGAAVPVRRPRGVGRLRAGRRRRAAQHGARAQPAGRRTGRAGQHAAARAARHAGPQPGARGVPTSRSTRSSRSCCRTTSRSRCRTPPGRPPAHRRRDRPDRGRAAGAAGARRGGAGRRPRGPRLVGARSAGRLVRRRAGRCAGRAGRRGRAAGDQGRAGARGTPAGAPRCGSATGSSGTPASCTRRWSRRWACRRAPARWSWTWTRSRWSTPDRPPRSRRTRRSRSTSPWSRRPRCRRPSWPTRCSTAADRCWRSCGCSTSTPASRSATGQRSLAFALRFRAPDRTLTSDEANAARDAAVAVAAQRHGARAARLSDRSPIVGAPPADHCRAREPRNRGVARIVRRPSDRRPTPGSSAGRSDCRTQLSDAPDRRPRQRGARPGVLPAQPGHFRHAPDPAPNCSNS